MNDIIIKLIKKEKILYKDITDALYEICDNTHSNCMGSCPVFDLNGGYPVNPDKGFKINRGCDCFKDGKAMLEFIKTKI